jgi:pimeloyl-ACP methyl ester carboxylesterase
MTERPVAFASEGETLAGTLHAPEAAGDTVLLLGGWGGTRYGPQRILVAAARALAEAGHPCLRFDYRGRGDSTGDPRATTLDDMIADTLAGVRYLDGELGERGACLVGICSGANVAIGAASLIPERVRAIVCWSLLPFMEHKEQARSGAKRRSLIGHFARRALSPSAWWRLLRGEANVRGAARALAGDPEGGPEERAHKTSSRDILAGFAQYRGRCDLIYGDRDPEFPASRAFFEPWLSRHRIPSRVEIIEGSPHNFYTAEWTDRVVARTVEWVGE